MKIVVVMPARGGSKRIPRKNVKDFKGKPLIAWNIEKCKSIKEINDVYVSSEDPEILEVSKSYGAKTIKRPKFLSEDWIATLPVLWHAGLKIKNWDIMIHLQPNSPFISKQLIKDCITILTDGYPEVISYVDDVDSGTIWGFTKKHFFKQARFDHNCARVKVNDNSIDIDTPEDWKRAEELWENTIT